jgi:DNA-binding NarL/FixJ family response regulator
MNTTHILLVDAHALVRAGLCVLLERISGVKVVAETGDGREVLSLAARHQPQIVLLDDGLPEVNAFEIVVELLANHPNVRVVILSAQDSEEDAAAAIRAGATGYLHKSAPPEELVRALEAVQQGEEYLASRPSSSTFIRGRAPAGNQRDRFR